MVSKKNTENESGRGELAVERAALAAEREKIEADTKRLQEESAAERKKLATMRAAEREKLAAERERLAAMRAEIEAETRFLQEERTARSPSSTPNPNTPLREVGDFWLTAPRYLRQAGRGEPEYVDASPEVPIRVTLPVEYTREVVDSDGQKKTVVRVTGRNDPFLHPAQPPKPKPAHAGKKKPQVRKAHEPPKGGRAADR